MLFEQQPSFTLVPFYGTQRGENERMGARRVCVDNLQAQ